ncbi:tyrosine-type recombinase/integrase [Streptomyces rhizosphaericus]|uniref:Tyrosine-type recombinase/integrase n=1 Tax=Streptomyces rhizosphaericus TaxID=114699 RepID=A0A6G4AXY5_9ACTN|nr:tyrosine-type recombinase/integrase [Streptomyces rhizosphaericus]NEW77327.1 tyrosine-type recombinase/integrase [Streptomyces rhizosphaericus]
MFSPSYYRRCQCKGPLKDEEGNPVLDADGAPKIGDIGLTCPKLGKGHGTWYFYFEAERGAGNKRARVRRGGFAKLDDAKKKAKELYDAATAGTDVLSDETCGDFFLRWIKAKKSLARTTRHGYEEHINLYLLPHLGHIKRRDLKVRHLDKMYDAIEKENAERILHRLRVDRLQQDRDDAHRAWVKAAGKKEERRAARRAFLDANAALREGKRGLRRVTSAATMHRINDTLSSALSWGIKREQAFAKNWAHFVELPPVTRPKPLVWTPERIEHWKRTGEKPGPVMVWTPELTGQFLDFVKDDWLYELWHSFIFLGPRRGEMAALPWAEVSTDALWLRISQQIVEVAYELYGEAPKADSVRTLSLSLESGDNLVSFRAKQEQKRQEWGDAYVETGRVWTHENGEALHPDWISRRFTRLVELSGLPPVRLHDLRHLAATLSLLAGTDIKVVQEKLGHSSRQITSDTYTSVLPEMMRAEAESVMAVVPRDVPFQVRAPLTIPETAWQGDIAIFFVHGARQSGDTWAVGAQTRPDSDLLGMITLAGRGQDDAANAAVKWIRDHCTANDLELVRVENFNDRYPEEQRADFSLTRFAIARSESPGLDGWALPTGLPPTAARTARRTSKGRRKAA